MKPRIFTAEMLCFKVLYGTYDGWRDELYRIIYTAIVSNAFKSIAEVAPRRDEVLPVTICRREAIPPLPER